MPTCMAFLALGFVANCLLSKLCEKWPMALQNKAWAKSSLT